MAETRPKIQVAIALIGLTGVLGAALIANWDRLFRRDPYSNTGVNRATPVTSPSPGPTGANPADCITSFLESVPKDRLTTLEAGAKDVQIIAPQQAKDQPIAVKLEEHRVFVGAIKFQFFSNGQMFKIESIVDAKCRPVNEFANASRGGDKNVLQNYDDLQIQFANAAYTISFEYGAGKIDAEFIRISPKP